MGHFPPPVLAAVMGLSLREGGRKYLCGASGTAGLWGPWQVHLTTCPARSWTVFLPRVACVPHSVPRDSPLLLQTARLSEPWSPLPSC